MVDPSRLKMLRCYLICLLSLSPMGLCASGIISHHSTELPAVYFVNDRVRCLFLGLWCTITFVNSHLFPTSNKLFYFKIFSQHVQKNGVKSVAFVCTLYFLFDELHDWRESKLFGKVWCTLLCQ